MVYNGHGQASKSRLNLDTALATQLAALAGFTSVGHDGVTLLTANGNPLPMRKIQQGLYYKNKPVNELNLVVDSEYSDQTWSN